MKRVMRFVLALAVLVLVIGPAMATASPPATASAMVNVAASPLPHDGTNPALAPTATPSPPTAMWFGTTLTAALNGNVTLTFAPISHLSVVNNMLLSLGSTSTAITSPSAVNIVDSTAAQDFPPGATLSVVAG